MLFNTTVYDICCQKNVLPWTILGIEDMRLSLVELFDQVVAPKLPVQKQDHLIKEVLLGKCKDTLDVVGDLSLQVNELISMFGGFMKFRVKAREAVQQQTVMNAFTVMMTAQGQSASTTLPPEVNSRNKKDELYNDLLKDITTRGLRWEPNEVHNGTAKRIIEVLRDVLWYIDGSHATLDERNCTIPRPFKQFSGYNRPEAHRHRKRNHTSLSREQLLAHSQSLFKLLTKNFWNRHSWTDLKQSVEMLARSISSYADLLLSKKVRMGQIHRSLEVVRSVGNNLTVRHTGVRVLPPVFLVPMTDAIMSVGLNVPVEIGQILPTDRRRRYEWLEELRQGLQIPLIHVTYSPGSNVGNIHWVWRTDATSIDIALQTVQPLIESLREKIPQYHTRAMRREAFSKFGLVTKLTKKSVLRHLYKDLVSDCSASTNLTESEIDARVSLMFELEEPTLLYDLRHHLGGRQAQYDIFWNEAKIFLEEDIGTAVDDRRHSTVIHVAKAVSVRDLRQQVAARCPDGTPIPSDEWIRLQFSPISVSSHTALRYTGRLKVRRKIQQRQFRKSHPDSHYGACLFRYEREYALLVRDHATFACLDDKHKIKIGEPGCPVAAAERGRQVIVPSTSQLQAADHDFTKFGMVPSVVLLVDIPIEISESWYTGNVQISFKDSTFEPSSPVRHATELKCILESTCSSTKPVLFLYTDGGPDHRVTYMSVKLSLVALFKKLDLDYLCAVRTAPYQSYRNPVERIMSVVNLGLQAIALARAKIPDELEAEAAKCNNMKALRTVASQNPSFRGACLDSVSPVKKLLTDIAFRLELKGKKFKVFVSATPKEISDLWTSLLSLDDEFGLSATDKVTAKDISAPLSNFISHCCRERHYFFDILKCGSTDCLMCSPPRLPTTVFEKLGHLPDPVPGDDEHYKNFSDVFKTNTAEEHRPSLGKKDKGLPFYASVQHVKNTQMMLLCEECNQWRLIYARSKLKLTEKKELENALEDISFSCGAQLQDCDIPSELMDVVYTRKLACTEPVEKLYYAARFADICVHCSSDSVEPWNELEEFYPQCENCSDNPKIKKCEEE